MTAVLVVACLALSAATFVGPRTAARRIGRELCRRGKHRTFHVSYEHHNFSFYNLTTECRRCGFRVTEVVGDRPKLWRVK